MVIHFFLFLAIFAAIDQVNGLSFSYPYFDTDDLSDFQFNGNSSLVQGALRVAWDDQEARMINISGRALYKKPYQLWSQKETKLKSFNTKFVFSITPQADPGGGLAFILTKDLDYMPPNSYGPWLGIVNQTTDKSPSNSIVAVEFDAKKSYQEDLDDNHVGVNINSMKSWEQAALKSIGVNISSGTDVTAEISYDGFRKELKVFVFHSNDPPAGPNATKPAISMRLDLSLYLLNEVYVGFSASTGKYVQVNCVKAWSFTVTDHVDSPVPIWVWLVVSLGAGMVLISIVVGYLCWRSKKSRDDQVGESDLEDDIGIPKIGPKKYQLKELKSATSNFDARNELGRGGFGIVYKGILTSTEVAVKRIMNNNQRGRKNMISEVTTIGSLHHKNLVKLKGWCYERNELLLVYEYMPNGSLDKHLFPEGDREQSPLSWGRRHNIICGVAQSLDYLHNECSQRVLHRDIKSSNIMLDAHFNACLGDFGLARMFSLREKTHHTTQEIAGTRAYMAPEIFLTGKATVETDIFAFGVLALEVVCGRRPDTQTTDGELNNNIADWVWELNKLEMICEALDPKLTDNYDKDQAKRGLLIGLACCNPNPNMRPSMRSALQVLMGEALPPMAPLEKPAFVWPAPTPSLTQEVDHSLSGGTISSIASFNGR